MRALKVVENAGTSGSPQSQASDAATGAAALLALRAAVEQLQDDVRELSRPGPPATPPFIITRSEHRFFIIDVNDIEVIEADGNYVRIRAGEQWYRHRAAIGAVEKKLGTRRFARVHRSSIVNLGAVRCIAAWFSGDYVIELKSGVRVRMSRTYWRQLNQRFGLD